MKTFIKKITAVAPALCAGFIFLLIFELSIKSGHIDEWILPLPTDILRALIDSYQVIFFHSITTVVESIAGLLLAIVIAWTVALSIYLAPFLKKTIHPFLIFSQTIPFIALAPLLVVWFGFGLLPKIIIVALVCFFPIVMNMIDSFDVIDSTFVPSIRLMHATKLQIIRFVIVPATLPYFFSGLRIAASYALVTAVVSEWIGATNGLGIYMIRSSKSYNVSELFASIVVVSILSMIYILIVDMFHQLSTPWQYGHKKI